MGAREGYRTLQNKEGHSVPAVSTGPPEPRVWQMEDVWVGSG